MSVFTVSIVCVIVMFACKLLEKHNAEYVFGLLAFTGCAILFLSVSSVLPMMEELASLVSGNEDVENAVSVSVKSVGICYVAGFAGSLCRDAGEESLCGKIELVAKITLAGLYLPLLVNLLKISTEWMGNVS